MHEAQLTQQIRLKIDISMYKETGGRLNKKDGILTFVGNDI